VSGGTNYPAVRNSGCEWLGVIPDHWTVSRFSYLKTVLTDFTANGSFADLKSHVVYRDTPSFARLVRLTDLRLDLENQNGVWIDEKAYAYLSKSSLSGGEFLLANVGAYAGLFYRMPFGKGRCSLAPNMFMAKFDPSRVSGAFIAYVGQGHSASAQLFLRARASSAQPKLNKADFKSVVVVYPPLEEQTQIAKFLDYETARIDALIDKQQQLIVLLKEKRQAVISHAVTKGLNPDAPMKDSGVEWLGEVPAHWRAGKMKFFAELRSGHTPSRLKPAYWEDCHIPWFSLADVWQLRDGKQIYLSETKETISDLGLANSAADLLPQGTVILSRTASVGFSGIMPHPMATTQDFVNWIPRDCLISEYLLFIFRGMASEFDRLKMGSTHKTIYMPDVRTFSCPVPPLNEQESIVRYLKEKLSIFEDATARAVELVGLLQERRTALISAAVTGKIDVRNWKAPESQQEVA